MNIRELLESLDKITESDKPDRSHGSPYDRGSADAYYGRPMRPPKDPEARKEYIAGYEGEEDRKDWGR